MNHGDSAIDEVYNIIASLRNNKFFDTDNIGPKLVKSICDIINPSSYILNLSFNCGQVPQCLKIAKVVSLYKKADKDNPGNYRPISLLSIGPYLQRC